MSDDESYHRIKERCIGHGFEWQLYVQKYRQSARLVLEPKNVQGGTTGFAWQINPNIAEVLLNYDPE
jgi:hypothetical protein